MVKKKLSKLGKRERKLEVLRKTVKRVVDLAMDLKAKVVVGKFSLKAKDRMRSGESAKLRHRIHQWSVVKFVELLKAQPIEVAEVSEAYTSSINPFNNEKLKKGKQIMEKVIKVFNPYLMKGSAHEGGAESFFALTEIFLYLVISTFID